MIQASSAAAAARDETRARLFLVAAILPLAVLLRIFHLGAASFWLDEIHSSVVASLAWPDFVKLVTELDPNMVFYYFLLHYWIRVGQSEFAIRSLSVIFAVATIPLLYALGTRLFGARVGLLAALLLSLNAFHVYYSQETRGYALAAMLVTASWLFFVRAVERPSRGTQTAYVLTSALAVYSHIFGVFILLAQSLSLALLPSWREAGRRFTAGPLVAGLASIPLVILAFRVDFGQVDWLAKPGLRDVYAVLNSLTGEGNKFLVLTYAILCALALRAAVGSWRASGRSVETWRYGVLLTWLVVPIGLSLAVSLRKPIFLSRFLLVSVPSLPVLAAVGVQQIRSRRLLATAVVVVAVLAFRGVVLYFGEQERQDWKGTVAYVANQVRPGDAALFYAPYVREPFDYYYDRAGGPKRDLPIVFPTHRYLHHLEYWSRYNEERPSKALLASLPSRFNRVWLVMAHHRLRAYGHAQEAAAIEATLSKEYAATSMRRFKGIEVELYSRPVLPPDGH